MQLPLPHQGWRRVTSADFQGYDHVVVATGVTPRTPSIPGIDHAKVASYVDLLLPEAGQHELTIAYAVPTPISAANDVCRCSICAAAAARLDGSAA